MSVEEQLRSLARHLEDQQEPVTGDEITAREIIEPRDADSSTPGVRGRYVVASLAIAAVVLGLVAGWIVIGTDRAEQVVPAELVEPSGTAEPLSPPTAAPTSTVPVPAAPFASSDAFEMSIPVVAQRGDHLGSLDEDGNFLRFNPKDDLPVGELGDQRVLDTASIGGGFYLVVCCDPGPSLWRNGVRSEFDATRLQFELSSTGRSLYVLVDDVNDVLRISADGVEYGADYDVPDLIDAVADGGRIFALIAGDDPHLVVFDVPPIDPNGPYSEGLDELVPTRREVPLPDEGPCSIVPVHGDLLVLYGEPVGVDRCVGDRAALIDGATGDLLQTLRLPAPSRQLNGAGGWVTIVTEDGRVIVGTFEEPSPSATGAADARTDPDWRTIVRDDAMAASVGFS